MQKQIITIQKTTIKWDANNLYWWERSQKLPIDNFEGENTSKSDEKFIKNYDENSDKG